MIDFKNLVAHIISPKTPPWKMQLITDWPLIMGNLHVHARVEKVYDQAVLLGVYDTCWVQEMHLLSNIIIKKINHHLGGAYINQIRLKYVQKHEFRNIMSINQASTTSQRAISPQEAKVLLTITDPELRNAMQAFLMRCNDAAFK